jgi:flagellar hook protein FlgE
MMRALFSGVSGLRNHQVRLDVIGNNIANVNTVAFKASRVTFEEAFAQMIQGGSRPPGDQGGVNPIQIGLGMNIGSVDQDFSQGNLQTTGQTTDLAIQGDGFFVVSDGQRRFFTRAGNFQLDADGRLVAPTNGFKVQGRNADASGVLSSNSALTDIVLPFGKKAPARATTNVTLSGNLDARAQPQGTILRSKGGVLAVEQNVSNGGAGSDVNGLYAAGNADAQILGMIPGGTTVTVSDGTTTRTYTYVVADTGVGDRAFHSLKDLVAEINNDFASLTAVLDDATGALQFTAGAAPVVLSLNSSNSTLAKALAPANGALAAGATALTDQFSHVARADDLLLNLRNSVGASLGLAPGQTILADGLRGGVAVSQGTLVVGAGTTYGDLLAAVDDTLGIVNTTGVRADSATGAMVITGDGGLVNALSGINVRVQGGAAPTFDAVFDSRPDNWQLVQEATDVTRTASITVYDSLGNAHVLTMTFTKDPTALNRWTWKVTVPGPATVTGGDSGSVTFDSDGRLESFLYDGGTTSFQFDPNNGASSPVDIRLDSGKLGDINGLSQFAAPSTAVASSQDGYPMGNLQDIDIDERGVITGFFTNGIRQTLAQIALASFNNPTGLLRRGDNMYEPSGNSGEPVVAYAGAGNQSTITAGALESSNVNLAQEFTEMIITQRGFQANARVITTADEMLNDLVNLRR